MFGDLDDDYDDGELDVVDAFDRGLAEVSGVCSECGCTEDNPCLGGCFWANPTATLCSRCALEGGP